MRSVFAGFDMATDASSSRVRRGHALLRTLHTLAVALMVSVLTGCDEKLTAPIGPATGHATPQRGGVLQLASFGDIYSLDPPSATGALADAILGLMFAGLVDYDERGQVVPDLAARFDVVDEGLTYRFHLREGVRFHDGEELTAEDVKRSIERALHPDTPNAQSSFFDRIEGYRAYATRETTTLTGIRVEGRLALSIHLRERDATFLAALATQRLRPVCRSAGRTYSDTWIPCGTGPFRFAAWDRGRELRLVRHASYFKSDLPYLDGVTWSFSMPILTQRSRFTQGSLDIVRDLSHPDAMRFGKDPRWSPFVTYLPATHVGGFSMNTELAPFDNVEVRRAVAAAVRRQYLALIRPNTIVPFGSAIPPGIPGFDPQFQGQSDNLDEALLHMQRAGFAFDPETGRGGYPHPVDIYAFRQGLYEFTVQFLQQELSRIGIRLKIHVVSYPSFLALTRRQGKVALSPQDWLMDFPDPSNFFEPLFSSAAINPIDSSNTSFYRNTKLDDLLARARREQDTPLRYALYGEANRIVKDDAPWAFTHAYRAFEARQPYVRNYAPHPVWVFDVRRAWLDRERTSVAHNLWERSHLARLLPREQPEMVAGQGAP